MVFPLVAPTGGWDAVLGDDAALAAGVATIARRHGLGEAPAHRYDSGSLPVYAIGERRVLKLFPPGEAGFAAVERRVLGHVSGRLPIATPEPVAAGTLDGWHYILMTQLRGQRLVDRWTTLTLHDRDRLADELGHTLATLHRLDTLALADLAPRWSEFIAAQAASAVERQRERRLAANWLEQIPDFIARWQPGGTHRPVLLHTEVMREHLMVEPASEGWRLSGLFDFEPAMLGDADYEFASVGLFVSCGDARFLKRTLAGYGHPGAGVGAAPSASLTAGGGSRAAVAGLDRDGARTAWPMRFMAHALLHRYSNLRWYLERLPAPGATTLEELALRWWGTAG